MTWYLESNGFDATVEFRENTATGAIQKRSHVIISLFSVHSGAALTSSEGTTRGVITWNVGTLTGSKSMGSGKFFLCTRDALSDIVQETGISRRTQTWEYYSPWIDTTDFKPGA